MSCKTTEEGRYLPMRFRRFREAAILSKTSVHSYQRRTASTICSQGHIREYTAFCSPHHPSAAGNPCRLLQENRDPGTAPPAGDITQCVTWPGDNASARVRCWTGAGTAIQCCGHGLLVAAASWRDAWPHGGELYMGGSRVDVRYEGRNTWLGFTPVPCTACPVPGWAVQLFGSRPIAAATAGPADGYLVLAWPQGSGLETLVPPGPRLASFTDRAIIASCATSPASSRWGESIRYRYFAPQYSTDEDNATGSALRVLTTYWSHHVNHTAFTAWQQSPGGGWLRGRLGRDKVWVGGEVMTNGRSP